MRLIDADKLFKTLNKLAIPFYADINNVINSQPTAYNVDKVVEQLEKEIKENPYQSEYLAGLYKAIEIVKAGEV